MTYNARPDNQLRVMSLKESEVLDAWTLGALVLDVPLGFLACTHALTHRVAYLQYLEEHSKVSSLRLSQRTCVCLVRPRNKPSPRS